MFDFVQLPKSIEIQFDRVRLTMPGDDFDKITIYWQFPCEDKAFHPSTKNIKIEIYKELFGVME